MDILSTILIALFSIPLLVLWSYRGGSLGWNWMPRLPRIGDMASTPLFICLCLLIALGIPTLFQALMMVLGFAAFVWAQVPGWGRQMDLGKNDKPDDEWGHTIRDWFFVEQSSYKRDLVGLYMRMAWFFIPAFFWFFVHPLAAIIPLSVALLGPQIWVLEDKIFWKKNKLPVSPIGHSWVEFYFGVMIALFTFFMSIIILFV
jgi:hypothetical protein